MFDVDELLGRASLRERIDELEDENERLRKRYEAESDRRAEATTARQDAEERINRLEDRIAQLEGELDQAGRTTAASSFDVATGSVGRNSPVSSIDSRRFEPNQKVR